MQTFEEGSAAAKWLKNAGLEDVHCGSNEVIFSQVQQFNKKRVSKEKSQRKTESFLQEVGANHSVL